MPSLLERAKTLGIRMAELGRIDIEVDNYQKLKTRADQVHKQANDVRATASSIVRMRANSISTTNLPSASKELRRQPATLRETLKSAPPTFANDSLFVATFLNPLQTYAEALRGNAQTIWRDYVDSIVPKINDSSLEMLSNAGFSSQVVRLRQLRDELRRLRDNLPANNEVFSKLGKLANEIELVWSELKGVPPAVMSFLNKATQRNATFADLTPEVNEWLKNKGLLQQLRIGLG